MTKILRTIALAAAVILSFSCSVFEPATPPLHRVTIMYAAAMSNLSTSIAEDIEDMCNGDLPTLKSGDVFLVYSHMPARRGYYDIPTEPVLFRVWREPDGTHRRDTLIRYPSSDVSSTPGVMRKVLLDAQELFPAPHFGMIVSSHGKGWIPRGYSEINSSIFTAPSVDAPEVTEDLLTKELCIESVGNSGINVNEFADAIPFKLDFLAMDTCLMGCIETAFELRGLCDLLLFSPTEVLADGFMYATMAPLVVNVQDADVKGVASQYFRHYDLQSGSYRSATITLVDCNKLDPVADECRALVSKYRDAIIDTPHNKVQPYFYNDLHWFFDLRDIFAQAGIPDEELAALDAALEEAVLFKASTESFLGLKMEQFCGLSMYKPYNSLIDLNSFYRTLAWNKAIGLL